MRLVFSCDKPKIFTISAYEKNVIIKSRKIHSYNIQKKPFNINEFGVKRGDI